MEENDYFKDDHLLITFGTNKFDLPLEYAKGNIGNIINFIMFALTNSGMKWEEIQYELQKHIRYDIELNQGSKTKLINPFNDEAK